jgi:hypothetical protein
MNEIVDIYWITTVVNKWSTEENVVSNGTAFATEVENDRTRIIVVVDRINSYIANFDPDAKGDLSVAKGDLVKCRNPDDIVPPSMTETPPIPSVGRPRHR